MILVEMEMENLHCMAFDRALKSGHCKMLRRH
jgi:hypothetical protein